MPDVTRVPGRQKSSNEVRKREGRPAGTPHAPATKDEGRRFHHSFFSLFSPHSSSFRLLEPPHSPRLPTATLHPPPLTNRFFSPRRRPPPVPASLLPSSYQLYYSSPHPSSAALVMLALLSSSFHSLVPTTLIP